jgi:tRNA1Val (adenine37-N6)-methyltransferase
MDDYLQPDFYRFNQDSILLVDTVLTLTKKPQSILDLGAGCGILGIELARKFHPHRLTLLEMQEDFLYFLKENVQKFVPNSVHTEIKIASFADFETTESFELIICNPPYFFPGHGQPSQDHRRGIARSFQHDNWEVLLQLIGELLSPNGNAFMVIKDDPRIFDQLKKHCRKLHVSKFQFGGIVIVQLSRFE